MPVAAPLCWILKFPGQPAGHTELSKIAGAAGCKPRQLAAPHTAKYTASQESRGPKGQQV